MRIVRDSDVVFAVRWGMDVTSLELPPPRCLLTLRATKPDAELRARFAALFVTDEDEAKASAWHASKSPEKTYVSTRDELTSWNLACPCGADRGKLFGVRKDDQFTGPVRFACTACAETVVIFDALADGWNAETAKRKRKARKEPKMTFAMHCRKCKETVWHPSALVTYQGESYAELPKERVQDYFDVIALGGTCATCGSVALGFHEECA